MAAAAELVGQSHGILSRPLPGRGLITCTVTLVQMSDFRNQRIIWIRIGQQRADGEEHFGNGERRRPLVTQNIQANTAITVDVWMVDAGGEVNLHQNIVSKKHLHGKSHQKTA